MRTQLRNDRNCTCRYGYGGYPLPGPDPYLIQAANQFGADIEITYGLVLSPSEEESGVGVVETAERFSSTVTNRTVGQQLSEVAYLESNGHVLRFKFEKVSLTR
jgi:hypothetical protein